MDLKSKNIELSRVPLAENTMDLSVQVIKIYSELTVNEIKSVGRLAKVKNPDDKKFNNQIVVRFTSIYIKNSIYKNRLSTSNMCTVV